MGGTLYQCVDEHDGSQGGVAMAHSVRPESFIEISNFYTLTVYEKGAEVVRMIQTLLGEEGFRKGSDLYFERHDGQAVTVDDFVKATIKIKGGGGGDGGQLIACFCRGHCECRSELGSDRHAVDCEEDGKKQVKHQEKDEAANG